MAEKIICKTIEEYAQGGETILKIFPGKKVFAFYGKMGVGKTTMIKAICKNLGVTEIVNSPSFSIINEYKTDSSESVYHIDFYRIKNLKEAFDIGYEDYLYSGSYCFIEWPEKIEELLPEDIINVKIEEDENDGSRVIRY